VFDDTELIVLFLIEQEYWRYDEVLNMPARRVMKFVYDKRVSNLNVLLGRIFEMKMLKKD